MFMRCRKFITLVFLLGALAWPVCAQEEACCGGTPTEVPPAGPRVPGILRITADPNNLPFSNERQEGFENEIAELVARELGMKIVWSWRAQRRGFFRETVKAKTCDLVMAAPAGYERALTTRPYYRSSYVFVSRRDRALNVASLDDPRLREWKIGVQLIGDDGANTPPVHALATRGVIGNLVGFTVFGDYATPYPSAPVVNAVAEGKVDVSLVWGPVAGFFASKAPVPLDITPVSPAREPSGLEFTFGIALAVQRGDTELKDLLDGVLERRAEQINAILDRHHVPRVPAPATAAASAVDNPLNK